MRTIYRFLLVCASVIGLQSGLAAQECLYVNTDNLIMRDRPEAKYCVFAVLHAGCRVETHSPEEFSEEYYPKSVYKDFYPVWFIYWCHGSEWPGSSQQCHGWVEKKYLVTKPELVTAKRGPTDSMDFVDENNCLYATYGYPPHWEGFHRETEDDLNYRLFPYPKYKGGVRVFPPKGKQYHRGPRGGCYYLGAKGQKIYVEKLHCR